MTIIAVTGATGFVGRAVVRRLLRDHPPENLRLLIRNSAQRPLPEYPAAVQRIDGDLEQQRALIKLVDGADAVVHIAAAIAGSSAETFERANAIGTRHLLQACRSQAPNSHLIHLSSLAAREPALSWYAASKHAAEQAVASSAVGYSMLRPPAVYGPDDPALADFWRWLARGWLIRLGPANARFSLLHVSDLAEAIMRLIEHGPTNTTLSLHDGHESDQQPGWSWPRLAQLATAQRGSNVRTLAIPSIALRSVAAVNLKFARMRKRPAMLSPGKHAELMHPDWVCDNSAIQSALHWQPSTSLAHALATLPGWNKV